MKSATSCSKSSLTESPPALIVSLEQWSAPLLKRLEQRFAHYLPATDDTLIAAMRYAVQGGKRIRALLAYATAEVVEAPLIVADQLAAALECLHAYSLVHDDLPAMDNDVLRRGLPTVHVAYGEATALLVGDALQALAFEMVADIAALSSVPDNAFKVAGLVKQLAQAVGHQGMVKGQFIDCTSNGQVLSRTALETMHRCKTGALLSASVMMAAQLTTISTDRLLHLQTFAQTMGLAFQVMDDWLDVKGDTVQLGKTAGKDALQQKTTFVSLLGAVGAKQLADDLLSQARQAANALGDKAGHLILLANFIICRTH